MNGLDQKAMEQAQLRWNQVAKPLDSLGIFEKVVIQMAGILKTPEVTLDKKALIIMCGDNGIVEEGVTQTGKEVTKIVTGNFVTGNSCVCLMAKKASVDVFPVDIGIDGQVPMNERMAIHYPLIRKKVASGTKNFLKEPAMSIEEVNQAIEVGVSLVKELKEQGYTVIATGEMGIGNTTTSSAVISVLLECEVEAVTGKGAGLSREGVLHKVQVIKEGIKKYHLTKEDPLNVLACVGGFDLAGLVGVFLGGAIHRIPIVLDGVISGAAALVAKEVNPDATAFMIASHVSKEPAGKAVLQALSLNPVIYGDLCLGEGSGAIGYLGLLDMMVSVYQQMTTFQENDIKEYQSLLEVSLGEE